MAVDPAIGLDAPLNVGAHVASDLLLVTDSVYCRFRDAATLAKAHVRVVVRSFGEPLRPVLFMHRGIVLTIAFCRQKRDFFIAGFVDLEGPGGFDPGGPRVHGSTLPSGSRARELAARILEEGRYSVDLFAFYGNSFGIPSNSTHAWTPV